MIDVGKTLGAQPASEITLLHYDSAAAGERFRANNPDVLQMIGHFHSRHVDRFIYYVGTGQD